MDFDQASKIYNEFREKYKTLLTPEQKELQAEMDQLYKLYMDPILSKKRKEEELKKLEEYRKKNPYNRYVATSDQSLIDKENANDSVAPAIQPQTTTSGASKSPTDPAANEAAPTKEKGEEKEEKKAEEKNLLIAPKKANRSHYMLPLVVKSLKAHCHAWLVGPAGSGKSSIAANAAAELNLPYASLSVCGQTTKTDLLGYMDAHGVYRTTCFRQAYEQGGVFCLDEVDNGNANVLAVINSALSNSVCTFPDKTIERHPNFLVVACANTFGLGAHSGYVGRTQIDAATLDRFFFIEIPYDDGLEMHIAGNEGVISPEWDSTGKKVPTATEWIELVKTVRTRVVELNVKAIISPRATLMGTSLIKEEVPLQFLQKGLLFKSLSGDVVSKLL